MAGLVTVTCTVPAVMMAELGMVAVSLDPLTKIVFSAVLPKLTTAPEAKLVPSTSNVNVLLPAITPLGFNCVMTGIVPGTAGIVE